MADKEAAKDGKDGKASATKTKESRKKIGLGR